MQEPPSRNEDRIYGALRRCRRSRNKNISITGQSKHEDLQIRCLQKTSSSVSLHG